MWPQTISSLPTLTAYAVSLSLHVADEETKAKEVKQIWLCGQSQVQELGFEPRPHKKLSPVFLPAKSHGLGSLVGYSPWGRKESDTTEQLNNKHSLVLSQHSSHPTIPSLCPGTDGGRGRRWISWPSQSYFFPMWLPWVVVTSHSPHTSRGGTYLEPAEPCQSSYRPEDKAEWPRHDHEKTGQQFSDFSTLQNHLVGLLTHAISMAPPQRLT